MIREELVELNDTAKKQMWGDFLLERNDVLYLVRNLTQEAGLETILLAAFSLKHAAHMKRSYSSRKEALHRAVQLAPKRTSPTRCKPPDFKQPNADSLAPQKFLASLTKTRWDF